MEKNYLVVHCDYCGKELKLWPSALRGKHVFCNKECDRLYKKGRSIGKYSDYQVNAMVAGKKAAYINRVLEMEQKGKYNLERIKYILSLVPISSTRQLAKLLGFKESESRTPAKELKYLLEYYNLTSLLRKEKFPECYTTAQPEHLEWFNDLLKNCNNYYEFQNLFMEGYRDIGLRQACAKYGYLVIYVQLLKIPTHALREDFSKNLKQCGTSCEIKVRNILDSLTCSYQEQKFMDWKIYRVKGETKSRISRLKPDFIVDDKFIIEVNGDYWHAYNIPPEKMNAAQLVRTSHDIEKYQFYNEKGYRFIVIWEHELVNINSVKNKIEKEILNERNYKTIIYN